MASRLAAFAAFTALAADAKSTWNFVFPVDLVLHEGSLCSERETATTATTTRTRALKPVLHSFENTNCNSFNYSQ